MPSFKLTAAGFRSWLTRLPAEYVVGVTGHEQRCPLATYVQDTTSFDASVCADITSIHCVPKIISLTPAWAVDFMRAIDGTTKPYTPITAERALAALGEAA